MKPDCRIQNWEPLKTASLSARPVGKFINLSAKADYESVFEMSNYASADAGAASGVPSPLSTMA